MAGLFDFWSEHLLWQSQQLLVRAGGDGQGQAHKGDGLLLVALKNYARPVHTFKFRLAVEEHFGF